MIIIRDSVLDYRALRIITKLLCCTTKPDSEREHEVKSSVFSDHISAFSETAPPDLPANSNNPFRANFPSHELDDELMFSLVQFDRPPHPDAEMPKRRARPRDILTILLRISRDMDGCDANRFSHKIRYDPCSEYPGGL
jgi:hypothetical protein